MRRAVGEDGRTYEVHTARDIKDRKKESFARLKSTEKIVEEAIEKPVGVVR